MTLIVAIQCSDGVVMASDSAATLAAGAAPTIGQQRMKKILALCNNSILFAGTGAVGMAQLISHAISTTWRANPNGLHNAVDGEVMRVLGQQVAAAVLQYLQTGALTQQLGVGGQASLCKSIVALPVQRIPQLFTFDFGGQPEKATKELAFVAAGSGQPIADPFLAFLQRLLWPSREPTLAEGRLAAVWTIKHVSQTNPGGVDDKIQLWMLPKPVGTAAPAVKELEEAEIQEHLVQVRSAEEALVRELTQPPAGNQAGAAVPAGPDG